MTTPLISAQTIADYVLYFFQWKCDPINNYKLQKLLYYVQGWHLAEFDEPAFPDRIEAWLSGPVCPEIFERYAQYTWRPILEEAQDPQGLPERLTQLIDDVLGLYGFDTGWSLEYRVHREPPWQEARKGHDLFETCTAEITHESMSRFFKTESATVQVEARS